MIEEATMLDFMIRQKRGNGQKWNSNTDYNARDCVQGLLALYSEVMDIVVSE